jgi:hypothetical protein
MNPLDRREVLTRLAQAAGAVLLVPMVQACGSTPSVASLANAAGAAVPPVAPAEWDAVAFNTARGATGAIPSNYMTKIKAPDGIKKHMGKHLPYVPELDPALVPKGFVPIMWGDASKGFARHPNAPKAAGNNNQGHWYNWIRVRKAVVDTAPSLESSYSDWPGIQEGDSGNYAVFGGGEATGDGGRNTIYLAALPKGVGPGDTIRVWAHCLTHGEYVDFVKLPEWIKV